MKRTYEDTEPSNPEDNRAESPEGSTRFAATQLFDALDLRLMDTFPASDAIAQY